MATKFEFLPRHRRRLPSDWRLPALFLLFGLTSMLLARNLTEVTHDLTRRQERSQETLTCHRQNLASATWALVPDQLVLGPLYERIRLHNYALVGPTTRWLDVFQIIDDSLPENAVISDINNLRTGNPSFDAEDREFRLTVVVTDNEASNALFGRLSARRELQGLTFTPKGEITFQGRSGTAIEVTFRLEGTS